MGSSVNTFVVHFRSHLRLNPQTGKHIETQKWAILQTRIQNQLCFNPNQQICQQIPSICRCLAKPSSYHPPITSSFSPVKGIARFFSEKIVVLLLGSFVFMGCLSRRHVLAQPVQNGSECQSIETPDGKFEEEEMLHMKLLEANPRNVEALKWFCHKKMRIGKTKEAVEYVERLIDLEPKEVEWRLLQALCYEMIGELSKAKSLFKKILKKRPLLLRALHGLAMVMHRNLEGPAVFEVLNEALEIARHKKRFTEERNIRILIAQMHVVKGELENASKQFQDLINEDPRDFRPYLCQGIIYSLLDREEEAEELFSTYQSLLPKEFPQRAFLEDVVLSAKTESRQQLNKRVPH